MEYQALIAVLILLTSCIAGCGSPAYVGTYTAEVRIKQGEQENPDRPLDAAREKHGKYGEKSLELMPNGRYLLKTGNRIHEGDWWVDANRIAIRCDTQNGQKMAAGLISEGADRYYQIRKGGELFRTYDSPDSNLEVVFSR